MDTKIAMPIWVMLIQYDTPTSQSVITCCFC